MKRPRVFFKLISETNTFEVFIENFSQQVDVVLITAKEYHERTIAEGDVLALHFNKDENK
jgi:hypothetical protein